MADVAGVASGIFQGDAQFVDDAVAADDVLIEPANALGKGFHVNGAGFGRIGQFADVLGAHARHLHKLVHAIHLTQRSEHAADRCGDGLHADVGTGKVAQGLPYRINALGPAGGLRCRARGGLFDFSEFAAQQAQTLFDVGQIR
ncbi:hypothetical protein [Xylella fastidiosa]|uniref:hypothetical protein n=1 Tax=Xylella fastidiosa TaxID=2371 RepID=UPI001E2B3E99|nr:hypothetical protein [Xylella fastidiosa]